MIYLEPGNSPGTKPDISLRPAPLSFKHIPELLRSPNVTNDRGVVLGTHKSLLWDLGCLGQNLAPLSSSEIIVEGNHRGNVWFMVCKGICRALLDIETFCGLIPNVSSVTQDTSKEPQLGVPNLYPLPPPQGILPATLQGL